MSWPFGDLKPNHYRLIYLDPPTKFVGGTKGRPQHYPRMTPYQLAQLPLKELAHPDGAWVACWITSPQLRMIFKVNEGWVDRRTGDVIAGWGAKYSGRGFVWIKTSKSSAGLSEKPLFYHRDAWHFGQGYTTRKNCEDVLLFKFGKPKRLSKKVFEPIISPVRENSRKPDEARDRLCDFAPGPWCELFARESTDERFAYWGNEITKFNMVAA